MKNDENLGRCEVCGFISEESNVRRHIMREVHRFHNSPPPLLHHQNNYRRWTEMNFPLPFPRCFSCMFVMSDRLYVIGGAGRSSELIQTTASIGSVDYWNDKKLEWKHVTDMSIPRHGHAVSYLGTQILIVGGVTTVYGRALSNTECFCSQRETWVRGLACLPTPLSGHSVVTLPPASLLSF